MKRLRLNLRLRLIILFSTFTFLLCFLLIQFYSRHAYRNAKDLIGQKLASVAAVAASQVDGDLINTLKRPQDMDTPAYEKIKGRLIEIRDSADLWETYTIRKEGDKLRFVVDAEEENPALLGEEAQLDPDMYTGFEGPSYNRDFTSDRWGTYLSGFAPIENKEGEVVGILGVDAEAGMVVESLSHIKRHGYLICLAALLISIITGAFISKTITNPIDLLVEGFKRLKKGEFGFRIEVERSDELGRLADAFNEMSEELKKKETIEHAFERYVSKDIVSQIVENPDSLTLKGERKRITVLFSDIRGFTKLSQAFEPEDILGILNHYFSDMVSIVFKYGGTLDKFMGDGLMAIFGAPLTSGDEEERAVKAALEMQERTRSLSAELQDRYPNFPELHIGIGIHTGYAVVGNVGCRERMEYTAIGDVVNLASRFTDHAERGQTLLSKETIWPIRTLFEVKPQFTKIDGRDVEVYPVQNMKEGA